MGVPLDGTPIPFTQRHGVHVTNRWGVRRLACATIVKSHDEYLLSGYA